MTSCKAGTAVVLSGLPAHICEIAISTPSSAAKKDAHSGTLIIFPNGRTASIVTFLLKYWAGGTDIDGCTSLIVCSMNTESAAPRLDRRSVPSPNFCSQNNQKHRSSWCASSSTPNLTLYRFFSHFMSHA